MLDYWPRKVSAPAQTIADVPECVIAFLRFLDDRESLSGEPLPVLEGNCEALAQDFTELISRGPGSPRAAAQKQRKRKRQRASRRRNRR